LPLLMGLSPVLGPLSDAADVEDVDAAVEPLSSSLPQAARTRATATAVSAARAARSTERVLVAFLNINDPPCE
jgi:hypothetical protein